MYPNNYFIDADTRISQCYFSTLCCDPYLKLFELACVIHNQIEDIAFSLYFVGFE